jgi:hypothetical protein
LRLLTPTAVRRYDLKNTDGKIHWKKTAPEVEELFGLALIDQETTCRITGLKEWHELNEYFPTLKYGFVPSPAFGKREPHFDRPLGVDDHGERGKTSALKAGWICCGIGIAIAWFFPPAHFFYSVAVILAIVAMCAHEVKRGLTLLLTCLAAAGLSTFIFFSMLATAVAVAAAPALEKAEQQRQEMQARMNQSVQTLNRAANSFNSPAQPQANLNPGHSRKPLTQWTASELLSEIARLEELHRASRNAKRPVPKGIADKLVETQAAYDAITATSR